MRYVDGTEAKLGDRVAIDEKYKGIVVAVLDANEFSERCPAAEWEYLDTGIVIDTGFGGLVHYPNSDHECIVLLERAAAVEPR